MSQTVQLSPEILQLHQDIAALVQTVGQVIAERDAMLNTIKPNLEAEYQKNIGYKLLACREATVWPTSREDVGRFVVKAGYSGALAG